jgi:hypothetical protein
MTTAETLKAARELIANPERWTKGWFAKKADGSDTNSRNPDAYCWCAYGALHRANYYEAIEPEHLLSRLMGGNIAAFNDTHTHPEVIAMFDKAIARAEVRDEP